MLMYNLIEYSDNYSGTTGSLWQYHNDEPRNPITDSNSFKFKPRFLAKTNCDGIIAVSIKYFTNFWRTLEMSLTDCGINLFVTW